MQLIGYRTRIPEAQHSTLIVLQHVGLVAAACGWPIYMAWAPPWLFFTGGLAWIALMTGWMLRLRVHHPARIWGQGTHVDTSATWTDAEGTWEGLVVQWKPEPPWMHWALRLGFFPLATAWTLWRAVTTVPWHLLGFWRPDLLIILGLMQWANPITVGTATIRTAAGQRFVLHCTRLDEVDPSPSNPL